MRILFANSYFHPHVGGGAEIILKMLADGMRGRGHEVHVLATGESDADECVDEVAVHRVKNNNLYWSFPKVKRGAWMRLVWHGIDRNNLSLASKFRALLSKIQPDVLISHNLSGLSIALWKQASTLGIPILHVLHDYYLLCPSVTMFKNGRTCPAPCRTCRFFRRNHALASSGVSSVIGVSRAILDTHLKFGSFSGVRMKRVIYNAQTLPPPIRPDESRPLAFEKFGFIGALSQVKGIEPLIRAFLAAQKRNPRISLHIAGSGEAEFVAHLQRIGSSSSVKFIGYAKPMEFLRDIDVCVAPSQWNDPFPGVVYESISQGVPVIGASNGGIPEIIRDGVNGHLYDTSENNALENLIYEASKKPSILQRDISSCVKSVEHLTQPARMLDEHEQAALETISQHKHGPH